MRREKTAWFEMWLDDKEAMICTMARNMSADLDAGYNYFGESIRKQREQIDAYKKEYDEQLMAFADMDDAKRDRWCYYDLLRRGVITR